MLILIEVVYAISIEQGAPTLYTMDFIALGQEQLGEVGSILPGDPSDKGDFLFCHGVKVSIWGEVAFNHRTCHLSEYRPLRRLSISTTALFLSHIEPMNGCFGLLRINIIIYKLVCLEVKAENHGRRSAHK